MKSWTVNADVTTNCSFAVGAASRAEAAIEITKKYPGRATIISVVPLDGGDDLVCGHLGCKQTWAFHRDNPYFWHYFGGPV